MTTGYICKDCRVAAVRTARAALSVLSDDRASETARQIAAEELDWELALLRQTPGLRVESAAESCPAELTRLHSPQRRKSESRDY